MEGRNPRGNGPSGLGSGGLPTSIGFGNIIVNVESYSDDMVSPAQADFFTPAELANLPYRVVAIGSEQELRQVFENFAQTAQLINDARIPYLLIGDNSNSAISTMLAEEGFPAGNLFPSVLTPGYGANLLTGGSSDESSGGNSEFVAAEPFSVSPGFTPVSPSDVPELPVSTGVNPADVSPLPEGFDISTEAFPTPGYTASPSFEPSPGYTPAPEGFTGSQTYLQAPDISDQPLGSGDWVFGALLFVPAEGLVAATAAAGGWLTESLSLEAIGAALGIGGVPRQQLPLKREEVVRRKTISHRNRKKRPTQTQTF